MYNLPYYKAGDEQEVIQFMHAHPFVTLVVNGDPYPAATQLPVIFEERDGKIILRAHMMKNTDHYKALLKDQNVLVLFTGAHSYVSASWYTSKQVGSTWNYQSVHAVGSVNFVGNDNLLEILTRLTDKFEKNPESPSLVRHLSQEYLDGMMRAITGFEIEIKKIEHVFKLSQNRDKQSFDNIITKLNEGGAGSMAVAAEMMKVTKV